MPAHNIRYPQVFGYPLVIGKHIIILIINMTIEQYIAQQEIERQNILSKIHFAILNADKTVSAQIGKMMGKEMIIYKAPGTFKYGLSSVKKYISLHILPIYCVPSLHSKFKELLTKASFQKSCINFTSEEAIPFEILKSLLIDCSKIDLSKIREDYLKSKKK